MQPLRPLPEPTPTGVHAVVASRPHVARPAARGEVAPGVLATPRPAPVSASAPRPGPRPALLLVGSADETRKTGSSRLLSCPPWNTCRPLRSQRLSLPVGPSFYLPDSLSFPYPTPQEGFDLLFGFPSFVGDTHGIFLEFPGLIRRTGTSIQLRPQTREGPSVHIKPLPSCRPKSSKLSRRVYRQQFLDYLFVFVEIPFHRFCVSGNSFSPKKERIGELWWFATTSCGWATGVK